MTSPEKPETTGKVRFDDIFDLFEARELARRVFRTYAAGLDSDIDREITLWMHDDRVSQSATDEDIAATLSIADLREAESLYGRRVWIAADRGRRQGNHSALRCFVREVRRARRDMMAVALYG